MKILSSGWLSMALLILAAMPQPAIAEKQVIRPGHQGLDGSKLEPFEASYEIVVGGEVRAIRRAHLQEAETAGEDGLRFTKTMERGETMVDEVQFVRASQLPLAHSIVSLEHGHQVSVWDEKMIRGFQVEADGSAAEKMEIAIDQQRFAGVQYPLMLASLPLAKGDHFEIPMITTMLGVERSEVTVSVVVKDREEVTAKSGKTYLSWVIESKLLDADGDAIRPPSTVWITDEAPYLIRSDTGGGRMVVELVEVR